MDTLPDTTGYMVAGYVITFITMGIYVLSMYIRSKNLSRDLETLKSIDEAEK
ncbi:MAG TPA: hypothetical protein PKL78_13810 [Anaerolineales bacterium]|nr:hypothetical protein [Anaerolineales bacterium]HNN14630.1 hypothetical protein [Anaerolineales bacterium]HNO31425.1 hypothetical protein [Anaerolineales bacterium]